MGDVDGSLEAGSQLFSVLHTTQTRLGSASQLVAWVAISTSRTHCVTGMNASEEGAVRLVLLSVAHAAVPDVTDLLYKVRRQREVLDSVAEFMQSSVGCVFAACLVEKLELFPPFLAMVLVQRLSVPDCLVHQSSLSSFLSYAVCHRSVRVTPWL